MKRFSILLLLLLLCITSCNEQGENETSKTPDTTAPEMTTEETTNETTAYKVIVDGEPSDQYEDIVIHAPTPNYLSWESEWQGKKFDIPEYKEHLLIETPRIYEVETECFVLTFDFHQKYYRVGDPMQVRITIKNKTSETLPVRYNGLDTGMIVFPDNSESRLFYEYRYYNAKYNVQQHEQGNYREPSIYYVNIPADESVDLERVYDLDPDFFERGNTYAFRYNCSCYMDGTEISIPLYAVKKAYTLIETVPDSTEPEWEIPEGSPLSSVSGDWYFDWQPFEQYVAAHEETVKGFSDAERAALIKTPTRYICESNGLTFDVIFFRETYKNGEAMQVRIAVTNHTDETVELMDFPSLSTRLVSDGGETLYADLNWMKQSERFSYYNEPTEHGMAKTTLLPEGTAVFERVILLDGLETYAGDLTFEYSFGKVFSGGEYATVRVPIELVP